MVTTPPRFVIRSAVSIRIKYYLQKPREFRAVCNIIYRVFTYLPTLLFIFAR